MKVGVIEDDPLMLRHLQDMLERLGCQVKTAADVDRGLAIARDWRPDAMVVDILMPDRDGLNFIMETRDLRDRMRVIAITGGGRLGAERVLEMAAGLGAHATLSKPIDEAELLRALKPA